MTNHNRVTHHASASHLHTALRHSGRPHTSSPSGLTSCKVTDWASDATGVHTCRDHPVVPPCKELLPSLALT